MAGRLALIVAALFTGAAFTSMSRSIRRGCHWMIARYSRMETFLQARRRDAGIACACRLCTGDRLHGGRTSHPGFLIGAIAIIAAWPWTLLVIKPVNDALLAHRTGTGRTTSRTLLVRWGALHAVRSALGAFASFAFLWRACLIGSD